jgi:hypothetical protein
MKRSNLIGAVCVSVLLWHVRADELPPGVPSPLAPDGKQTAAMTFTTKAYHDEAFRLLLREANLVAKELALPEKLPITETDVVRAFIAPFGYAYAKKAIGNITTGKYFYGVGADNKFSDFAKAQLDEACFDYRDRYQLPIREIDTNGAHLLATQFLAAMRVDVRALEKDCQTRIKVNDFWNGVEPGKQIKSKTFVPLYDISWAAPNKARNFGVAASVELFTPTKTLLQLQVYYPEYILRKPIVFTNLAELLTSTSAPPTGVKSPNMDPPKR